MKDKIKGWYIHRLVTRQGTHLAKITCKFLKHVRIFCKRYNYDYNKTLSFMLKTIIEQELSENVD